MRTGKALAEPDCKICHGTRLVRHTRSTPHGDVDYVIPCECQQSLISAGFIESAGIPQRYRDCTIDGLEDLNRTIAQAKKLVGYFLGTADKLPGTDARTRQGLLFIGPCGTGKTHLAVATLKEFIQKTRKPGLFVDYRSMLHQIRTTYGPAADTTERAVLDRYTMTPLLVLDELGAERVTDWTLDIIFYVLNERYMNKRLTLITTNYLLESGPDDQPLEERIGKRLISRLCEMCTIVPLDGEDYRRR